jgi:hypothetical protein
VSVQCTVLSSGRAGICVPHSVTSSCSSGSLKGNAARSFLGACRPSMCESITHQGSNSNRPSRRSAVTATLPRTHIDFHHVHFGQEPLVAALRVEPAQLARARVSTESGSSGRAHLVIRLELLARHVLHGGRRVREGSLGIRILPRT